MAAEPRDRRVQLSAPATDRRAATARHRYLEHLTGLPVIRTTVLGGDLEEGEEPLEVGDLVHAAEVDVLDA